MINQTVTIRLTRAEASTLMHLLITEERRLKSLLQNSSRDYGESEEIGDLSLLRQKIHDQI